MSEPIAYRIKDFGDGWILQETITDSERAIYAEQGNIVEALVPAARIEALERENAELRASRDGYAKQDAARYQEARRLAIEECARMADEKASEYEAEARDIRNSPHEKALCASIAVRLRGLASAIRALKPAEEKGRGE